MNWIWNCRQPHLLESSRKSVIVLGIRLSHFRSLSSLLWQYPRFNGVAMLSVENSNGNRRQAAVSTDLAEKVGDPDRDSQRCGVR